MVVGVVMVEEGVVVTEGKVDMLKEVTVGKSRYALHVHGFYASL